ncbi:MAG: HEAT repeat domain-containing protein [Anaerolineales bacterium]|nr:HEAT repeat domain-containing protein [Anaerolineales bacterium]
MDSAPAFLLARLHEGNPDERWWAVRVLSELSQVEARAAVRRALDDSNHEVRLCAALALRNHPDPEALSKLGELLTAEERLLARLAGDALIGLGDLATPILVDTLENGPQIARVEAVRALAHTDDLQAVSALFNCLDDESAIVAYWVDLALERRGIGMVFYNQ